MADCTLKLKALPTENQDGPRGYRKDEDSAAQQSSIHAIVNQ